MTPSTLTPGHTYKYNDILLVYQYETINHYVFRMPDDKTMKLTFSDVKNNLIEIT